VIDLYGRCIFISACASLFRMVSLEGEFFDVEHNVKVRDMQIQELEIEVSDMRGKFVIPKLKKVHTFKLNPDE